MLVEQTYLDDQVKRWFPLAHPDGAHHMLVTVTKTEEIFAQVVLPDQEAEPVVSILQPTDIEEHELDLLLGHTASSPSHYQLFFADKKKSRINLVTIDTRKTPALMGIKKVVTLPTEEQILGVVGAGLTQDLLTIKKNTSIVYLYRFSPEGTFEKFVFDLSEEEFESSPFGTLYAYLVNNWELSNLRDIKALGIESTEGRHPLFQRFERYSKLFIDDGHVILVADLLRDQTLLIDFYPERQSATVHRIAMDDTPCQDQWHTPSSYYCSGKVWQLRGCYERYTFQVYDLNSRQFVYSELLNFQKPEETPPAPLLTSLFDQPSYSYNVRLNRKGEFFEILGSRLSVFTEKNGNTELRLELIVEAESPFIEAYRPLVSSPYDFHGPSEFPKVYPYSPFGSTVIYTTAIDSTFEQIVSFSEEKNIYSIAKRLRSIDEIPSQFQFFQTSTRLWGLFWIASPREGYEMRSIDLE